jgi:hypothetical protein
MKNINELDVASILKNLAGDTARNVLTSIPGVGTAVGIGASVKNYSELNDDLEKYKELKASIVNDEDIQADTLKQLLDVQDELEVDFIDLLQSIVGISSIPGLGFITQGLGPLLVKLSIEEILEKISSIIPIGKDAEKSMIPYLAAIKDIEDLKIKAEELEPLSKDADEFMDQMLERNNLEEGRKKTGTKLCARGKAAAKAKFDVYPSAYANGYAVQVCQGRIKGLDGKKRSSGAYS